MSFQLLSSMAQRKMQTSSSWETTASRPSSLRAAELATRGAGRRATRGVGDGMLWTEAVWKAAHGEGGGR